MHNTCSHNPAAVVREIGQGVPSSTIAQFCIRHHIGRTTYFKMRKAGCSPKELRMGRVVRITAEAEREWLERMQSSAMEAQP